MSEKKRFKLHGAIVNTLAMPMPLAEECVDVATKAIAEHFTEKDIASAIKTAIEERHGGHWHVFVGRTFGLFVTHEANKFLYFYLGQVGVALFAT